jgi:uncharacterized protein YkwD
VNRRLFISAALAAIILVFPSIIPTTSAAAATSGQRCVDMTKAVNARREAADLRTLTILCRVAEVRARDMVVDGYFAHDLAPAKRALKAAGIRWCNIGEVMAWHSSWQTPSRWATEWWSSPEHKRLLNDDQFDAGAGSFTGTRTYYPHAVAVYYVVDLC